jgi:RNA recognition motif-containing protein
MFRHSMGLGSLEKSRCHTAWVGGLPKDVSRRDIMEFFEGYNPVECKIIKERGTPFSFIYFETEKDRDNAIQAKRGCKLKGVDVIVNISFNAFEGPRLGGKVGFDEYTGRYYKY